MEGLIVEASGKFRYFVGLSGCIAFSRAGLKMPA
jgi:hypothetical protein